MERRANGEDEEGSEGVREGEGSDSVEGMRGGMGGEVTTSAASDGEVCEQQERRKPDRPHASKHCFVRIVTAYAFCFVNI